MMYYQEDREQLSMEEFFQPFGGRLRKDNRWVRLAAMMPWEYIEAVYIKNMSKETGRPDRRGKRTEIQQKRKRNAAKR